MKYIARNNESPSVGVAVWLVWWLFLDRLSAPGWVFGVVFTLLAILVATQWYRVFFHDAINIFDLLDRKADKEE